MGLNLRISSLVLTLLALGHLLVEVKGDECAGLFFTPAWQECFRNKLQRNWVRRDLFPEQGLDFQPLVFPSFQPIVMPNIDEIISEAQVQAAESQGDPGQSSFSSSSFSSSSGGTSSSLLSANGRTWAIESNGLPISSTNTGTTRHVQVVIGEPESVQNSFDEPGNSIKIDFRYGDGTTKWVKLTLDSSTRVKDLTMERGNGILHITGEM